MCQEVNDLLNDRLINSNVGNIIVKKSKKKPIYNISVAAGKFILFMDEY